MSIEPTAPLASGSLRGCARDFVAHPRFEDYVVERLDLSPRTARRLAWRGLRSRTSSIDSSLCGPEGASQRSHGQRTARRPLSELLDDLAPLDG